MFARSGRLSLDGFLASGADWLDRNINEAFARLESGKARYRIVLDADF